jgi:hypothetical protein
MVFQVPVHWEILLQLVFEQILPFDIIFILPIEHAIKKFTFVNQIMDRILLQGP